MDVNAIYFPFTKDSKFTKLLQAGRLANYRNSRSFFKRAGWQIIRRKSWTNTGMP